MKLTLMIGIPGSGKSSLCRFWRSFTPNMIVLNADLYRKVISGNESEQKDNHIVYRNMENTCAYFMEQGVDEIIIDCTNLTRRTRKTWLTLAKQYGYSTEAFVMQTTLEESLVRNSQRERKVPEDIIKKMFAEMQPVTHDEVDSIKTC